MILRAILLLCSISLFASCARPKPQMQARDFKFEKPKTIIVLDPGHGGEHAGTKMVIKPYTKEKTLALQTAHKVKDLLENWGYTVRLTRTKDLFVPLEERVQFARQYKGSLFVSLHFNHAPNKEAHGVEIFYSEKSTLQQRSKKLAQDILKSIIAKTKAASRGVHGGNFHVLRENSMPAVLVEGGFFSNVQEAKKLSTPKYQNSLALAIATGIDTYLQHE